MRKKVGYGLLVFAGVALVSSLIWAMMNPAPAPVVTPTPTIASTEARPRGLGTLMPQTACAEEHEIDVPGTMVFTTSTGEVKAPIFEDNGRVFVADIPRALSPGDHLIWQIDGAWLDFGAIKEIDIQNHKVTYCKWSAIRPAAAPEWADQLATAPPPMEQVDCLGDYLIGRGQLIELKPGTYPNGYAIMKNGSFLMIGDQLADNTGAAVGEVTAIEDDGVHYCAYQ